METMERCAADEEPLHKYRTISSGYPGCHVREKYFSLFSSTRSPGNNHFERASERARTRACVHPCV